MYLSPLATARPKFGLAHDSHARGRPPLCRSEAGSRLGLSTLQNQSPIPTAPAFVQRQSEACGEREIKGKGKMKTYFLLNSPPPDGGLEC